MDNWLFDGIEDLDAAQKAFDTLGYCAFSSLISSEDVGNLLQGIEAAVEGGQLIIGGKSIHVNNDVIYVSSEIETLCRDERIVHASEKLLGCEIELQHSKFNAKPIHDDGAGAVPWHQDYPFFPHSNYDLIACVIHLDDEESGSGSMEFISGSHTKGVVSHVSSDGSFAYQARSPQVQKDSIETMYAKRGWVSFHHGLTLHRSGPKTIEGDRRLLVFQYRAQDAVQLAGVIWRCTGYKVHERKPKVRCARFPNGDIVELRGDAGRLYDLYGRLEPDAKNENLSY